MKVIGVIESINSRDTSIGVMYDVVVKGQTYGAGKYRPRGVDVGDTVEFDVEIRGNYRNIAKNTLRKAASSAAPSPSVPDTGQRVVAPREDDRQRVISRQAALNTSVAFVTAALEAECVPLPAKVPDRLAYLGSLVVAYASAFHNISTGSPLDISNEALNVDVASAKKRVAKAVGAGDAPVADTAMSDDDIPF